MVVIRPILTYRRDHWVVFGRHRMACNGFNHPADCTCNFRGGHAGTQPPRSVGPASLFGDLAPPRERRAFADRRPRGCSKCGLPTFYIPGRKGGRFIAAGDGSFLKHNCQNQVPERPLRLAPAKWRREGFPATLRMKNSRISGQVLEVLGLAEGKPFTVRVLDGIIVDETQPAICRWAPDDRKILEITYVDNDSGDLTGTCIRARRIRG